MANVYGTAPAVDDEGAEQPHAVAATSEPLTFVQWSEDLKYDRAPAYTNISNTLTTFSTMRDFAHALTINTSVKKLNLTNCVIGDRSVVLLIDALSRNVTLESLNIKQNPISGYFLERLLEVARDHPALKVVKYDDHFLLDLPDSDEAKQFVQRVAAKEIEDLVANRAPVVRSIGLCAWTDMGLDELDEDSAFPRLQRVIADFPMSVSTLENFIHLMNGAPALEELTLSLDVVEGLHEDNVKNLEVGNSLLDAMIGARHLKKISLEISEYSNDETNYSLFDLSDQPFLLKMRSLIQTHPSLETFSFCVPDLALNFKRTFRETKTGPVLGDVSFLLKDTNTENLAGLSLVTRNNLANHLVTDFATSFSARNMDPVVRLLVEHPFEYFTLRTTPKYPVDHESMNKMVKALRMQKASVSLHLMIQTNYIAPMLKYVSEFLPNVTNVTYEYHPNPDQAALQEHTGRIIGGRGLLERLLPLLGDRSSPRTVPQRHIVTTV